MSFVLFTPPARNQGLVRPGQSPRARTMARLAGPLLVGQTIWKKDGTWHIGTSPSAATVADADAIYVGGHWHSILESTAEEILAAGIAITWLPSAAGTWPGANTFPATNLYPGVA